MVLHTSAKVSDCSGVPIDFWISLWLLFTNEAVRRQKCSLYAVNVVSPNYQDLQYHQLEFPYHVERAIA